MSQFYVLMPEAGIFGTKWAHGEVAKPKVYGDCQSCPVDGSPVTMLPWLPPRRLKVSSAKPEKWGDFLWGAGFDLMVSSRFKSVYEAEGLSGIAEFSPPAEIVRLGTQKVSEVPPPHPIYHSVNVPWGGANQDDAASGVVFERPEKITCQFCRAQTAGRRQERITIEEGSWNGADIFIARGLAGTLLVSERFKRVTDEHRLKNVLLIPAEKYGYDEGRPKRGLSLWYVNEQ